MKNKKLISWIAAPALAILCITGVVLVLFKDGKTISKPEDFPEAWPE